jgi:hypothetical protein
VTDLEMFDLGTSDFTEFECEDGDDADVDAVEDKEESRADEGSTQNVEDQPANQ